MASSIDNTDMEKWDTAWSDRNQTFHGYNAATRQTALHQEVRQQLTTIYDRRPS
jgi:hypothetical protein